MPYVLFYLNTFCLTGNNQSIDCILWRDLCWARWYIYITVILIVLFYISIGNVMTEADTTYIDDIIALSILGCTWSYTNIHGWGKLDTDYLSLSELEKELCQGMEDFFPHGYHNIEKDINDKVRYITMEGQTIMNRQSQLSAVTGTDSYKHE